MNDWLADLKNAVGNARRELETNAIGLDHLRRHLKVAVERAAKSLNALEEEPAVQDDAGIDHARVVSLARSGQFSELRSRERRYAARLLGELPPEALRSLLDAAPTTKRHFLSAALNRWHDVLRAPNPNALAELVAEQVELLPSSLVPILTARAFRSLDVPSWVLAHLVDVGAKDLLEWLNHVGLSLRWSLTGYIVAAWLEDRLRSPTNVEPLWRLVHGTPLAAAILPRPRSRTSEGVGLAPLEVRCGVVMAFLRAVLGTRGSLGATLEELIEFAIESELNDPRIPPVSEGWRLIERRIPSLYERLLHHLIREDIQIFFEHAMNDPARRAFWLKYVRQIRRTTCLLCPSKHESIVRYLGASTDARFRAASKRALRLKGGAAHVNAFVIYFEQLVVVEFSETPNAAYVYDRSWFERSLGKSIGDRLMGTANDLKTKSSIARIVHVSGWEGKAEALLARNGVVV